MNAIVCSFTCVVLFGVFLPLGSCYIINILYVQLNKTQWWKGWAVTSHRVESPSSSRTAVGGLHLFQTCWTGGQGFPWPSPAGTASRHRSSGSSHAQSPRRSPPCPCSSHQTAGRGRTGQTYRCMEHGMQMNTLANKTKNLSEILSQMNKVLLNNRQSEKHRGWWYRTLIHLSL